MFSEERGAGSSPHIAMPHALRTWLPPAEVDAQIFDTPALQEDLGAVLVESQSPAEAAEPVDAPAPPSLGAVLAEAAEPVDAPAPPSLGAVLAEAAEPAEPQSPAEFSTPPTQPEAIEASAAEAVGPADEGELAAEQRPCKKSRLP